MWYYGSTDGCARWVPNQRMQPRHVLRFGIGGNRCQKKPRQHLSFVDRANTRLRLTPSSIYWRLTNCPFRSRGRRAPGATPNGLWFERSRARSRPLAFSKEPARRQSITSTASFILASLLPRPPRYIALRGLLARESARAGLEVAQLRRRLRDAALRVELRGHMSDSLW